MEVINLPERLRDLAETLCGCQWMHPLGSPATCNEAADEIERLRAIVDKLPKTAEIIGRLYSTREAAEAAKEK